MKLGWKTIVGGLGLGAVQLLAAFGVIDAHAAQVANGVLIPWTVYGARHAIGESGVGK